MITSAVAITATCLGVALVGLLVAGSRWKTTRTSLTILYSIAIAMPAWFVAENVWELPRVHLWTGLGSAGLAVLVVNFLEKDWNPPSRAFLGLLIATSIAFLGLGIRFAFWAGIGPIAAIGSLLLVGVETFAFVLLAISTHDVLNVVGRVRWHRSTIGIDRGNFEPFVSVHVATHNEPPELVVETLRSLAALDYENYEVIVLDNNTEDPALWRPLEEFCATAPKLRFVHLEDWPGFKSGALNHGLEIADPRTELIAVVDADFVVRPDFLDRTVGFFSDKKIGFVQTRQDFVTDDNVPYLRRLALTYRTFDEITMPSRNERDSIIFAGTMGLIRHDALKTAGGWSEWCVTEDAELSLRMHASGFSGVYVDESFGRGVMPLTFAGLKRQRFRWCFGGIQILRAHWRLLVTGHGRSDDGADLKLTPQQRFDYLAASLQWFQSLLTLFFSALLVLSAASRLAGFDLELRPLVGLFVLVPALLLISGISKAVWGLRARLKVGIVDVLAVVAIWLSLSWAVALGSIQGVAGRELPFFRTPKFKGRESLRQTLSSTRAETPMAAVLSAAAIAIAVTEPPSMQSAFLVGLCAWGAIVFWSAPAVAFAASRADLHSGTLKKRRSLESIGGRTSPYRRPLAYGFAVAAATVLMVVFIGGSSTVGPNEDGFNDLFTLPERNGAKEKADKPEERVVADQARLRDVKGPRASAGTQTTGATGESDADSGDGTNDRAPTRETRGQSDQPVSGPGGTAGTSAPPGQNDPPAPQASEAPGNKPTARPTQAADPEPSQGPESRPSPKPRPTNANGGGG